MTRREHIMEQMKGSVYQYRKATDSLMNNGYYLRQMPYSQGGYADLYVLAKDGVTVILLASNCSVHRCRILAKSYTDGTLDNVPEYILTNYTHNGYMTRRGLFADYDKSRNRIECIADSHIAIPQRGTAAHDMRVRLRNY